MVLVLCLRRLIDSPEVDSEFRFFILAMKTIEERKAAQAAIEEEKRRAKGERAYRDWLRTSRNKPLPVPLNQGELS